MLVTNDENLSKKVKLLRNYGKPEPRETYCLDFGLNWRLNELAAIVGVAQLKRLDEFIDWRSKIAALYDSHFAHLSSTIRTVQPVGRCSWYKYIVILPTGMDRKKIKDFAKEQGVSLSGGVYDIPLHNQPAISKLGIHGSFPNADDFCARHNYPIGRQPHQRAPLAGLFSAEWRHRWRPNAFGEVLTPWEERQRGINWARAPGRVEGRHEFSRQ